MLKKGAGLAATVALSLAAIRFSSNAANPIVSITAASPASQSVSRPRPIVKGKISGGSGGCVAYDDAKMRGDYGDYPRDDSEGEAQQVLTRFFGKRATLPSDVQYLLALAPDPRHTNLSLMFDREVVTIEQAARKNNFTYDSSWMPWKTATTSTTRLEDRQYEAEITAERESCPGLMLFRGSAEELNDPSQSPSDPYAKALVVLLVGEQPTGGINQDQWDFALEWLRKHKAQPSAKQVETRAAVAGVASGTRRDKSRAHNRIPKAKAISAKQNAALEILGPTFSGSLDSLGRLLKKAYPATLTAGKPSCYEKAFPNVLMLSGTISGGSAIAGFERNLFQQKGEESKEHSENAQKHVRFGSFQENDDLAIYRFRQYLDGQHVSQRDIAILSEDETAYTATSPEPPEGDSFSAQPSSDDDIVGNRPLHIVYPRDISALRDAYQKQSVFDTVTGSKDHVSHAVLRQESADGTSGTDVTDTVSSYSGNVLAIAQEAQLFAIVSYLRVHHAKYLLLRCTNPLDYLFLTRFFHRAYPQARIVTVGSDLLFRREIDTSEFRGVLALTNYPLLPPSQHWSHFVEEGETGSPDGHLNQDDHLVFESHLMEGSYLAARYLLGVTSDIFQSAVQTPLRLPRDSSIPDYENPVWLTDNGVGEAGDHPPTWLAVLGREGYWPVAVLDDSPGGISKGRGMKDTAPPSTMVHLDGEVAHPYQGTHHFPFTWKICVALAVLLMLYQLVGISFGSGYTSDDYFSVFRSGPKAQPHQVLLGLSSALAFMPLVELLSAYFFSFHGERDHQWEIPRCVVGLVLLAATFIYCLVHNQKMEPLKFPKTELVPEGEGPLFGDGLNITDPRTPTAPLTISTDGQGITEPSSSGEVEMVMPYRWLPAVVFVLSLAGMAYLYLGTFSALMELPTKYPLFSRMVHVTNGVSPLLPVVMLSVGFYLWSWNALSGSVMLGDGRPLLPLLSESKYQRDKFLWSRLGTPVRNYLSRSETIWAEFWRFCLRKCEPLIIAFWFDFLQSSDDESGRGLKFLSKLHTRLSNRLGARLVQFANPFYFRRLSLFLPVFVIVVSISVSDWFQSLPMLGIDGWEFNRRFNLLILVAFLMSLVEALRLHATWVELRRLLLALGRTRLRRTISRLRPIAANSLWSVTNNVNRVQFRLFYHQHEAACRLLEREREAHAEKDGNLEEKKQKDMEELRTSLQDVVRFGFDVLRESRFNLKGTASYWWRVTDVPGKEGRTIRQVSSDAVAVVINTLLRPEWLREKDSLNLMEDGETEMEQLVLALAQSGPNDAQMLPLHASELIKVAEEFVAYHYIAFIQNIVARMRTMVMSMIFLFMAVCGAISLYPFVPRTVAVLWMMLNLVLIGAIVVHVYAGMDRDEVLSYIANTKPGRLGAEFWVKLTMFLAGPVIGILATQFPVIADSVFGWLQPGFGVIK